MLRPLLISLLIYSTSLTTVAQQIETLPEPPKSVANQTSLDWPAGYNVPHDIRVITMARPKVRLRCEVVEVTTDALVCQSGHDGRKTVYHREEVLKLVVPPSHYERNIRLIPIVLLVASLAGSFFVPLAWSVTLRVGAGLFFTVIGAMGLGETGDDHSEDIVLYERPVPSINHSN